MFDRKIDEIQCNKVLVDDFGGGYIAAQHLIDIGCKKIAILTTPNHVTVGNIRLEGYIKALTDHNILVDESLIVKVNEEHNIADQIKKLFKKSNCPDGIFAVNEIYAATAIKIAKNNGLNIPNDIAIMGFTDGLISQFSSPQLTTVAQHGFTMGEKSMEILLEELNQQDTDYQYQTNIISTDIVFRESTKKTN